MTVGNNKKWLHEWPLHRFVLDQLLLEQEIAGNDGIHLFVDVPDDESASLSQTLRIFAASLSLLDDSVRLVTTDTDIWPVDSHWLDVDNPRSVLVTNAFCCEIQELRNVTSRHYPLCHVSMLAEQWRSTMNYSNFSSSAEELVTLTRTTLESFFGPNCTKNVKHGGPGWSMDQKLISYRLAQSSLPAPIIERKHSDDARIDRDFWPAKITPNLLSQSHDAHLPHYDGDQSWSKIRSLLINFYTEEEMVGVDMYEREFRKLWKDQVKE